MRDKDVGIAVAVALAVGFYFGMVSSKSDPFPEFVPRFNGGQGESDVCYVLVEQRERELLFPRPASPFVFKGCWSEAFISKARDNWEILGIEWPYQIVAEYDRHLDPLDLDPRY